MSSPTSSRGPVLRYLLAQVAQHPNVTAAPTDGAEPPLVCLGPPGTYQPADIIAIGTQVNGSFNVMAMVGSGAAGWLREDYAVEVVISCFRGVDDLTVVMDRCEALMYAVVDTVRADPTLGGAVNIVAEPTVSDMQPTWADNHQGWEVRGVLEVKVAHQL